MSNLQKEVLQATNEAIEVIHKGQVINPYDEDSTITIDYVIDDNAEDEEIDNPDYLIHIHRIFGSLNIGNPDSALCFMAKVDSDFDGWKISCTRVERINGMIFPHSIEINLDNMSMLVKFDVLG